MPNPEINSCSVRVMRSHDYCHFEVVLGCTDEHGAVYSPSDVDLLRKVAARLADKAVEQYIRKKEFLARADDDQSTVEAYADAAKAIEAKPETDRTPEEQAILKDYKDALYRVNRGDYDYQDDWDD